MSFKAAKKGGSNMSKPVSVQIRVNTPQCYHCKNAICIHEFFVLMKCINMIIFCEFHFVDLVMYSFLLLA